MCATAKQQQIEVIYMGRIADIDKGVYILLVLAAFAGWCVIELVLWLFSFVSISFG